MTYTPTPEAVEAAARAAALVGRVYQDGLTPEQQFERNWQDEEYREQSRAEARAALTAAGPIIAAEALREAAVAVGTYDEGDVHLWARDADTWLMARAARIARGEGS